MLEEFTGSLGRSISGFSTEAEGVLCYYSWPGNIRELRNVVERAVLLCTEGIIQAQHLPEDMRNRQVGRELTPGNADLSLEDSEKVHIQNVLKTCRGNHSQAARILKIHRSTLIKKIKKYQLE